MFFRLKEWIWWFWLLLPIFLRIFLIGIRLRYFILLQYMIFFFAKKHDLYDFGMFSTEKYDFDYSGIFFFIFNYFLENKLFTIFYIFCCFQMKSVIFDDFGIFSIEKYDFNDFVIFFFSEKCDFTILYFYFLFLTIFLKRFFFQNIYIFTILVF